MVPTIMRSLLVAMSAAALACGETADTAPIDMPTAAVAPTPDGGAAGDGCRGGYLPLTVGARWAYRVTRPGDLPTMKVQTLVRLEAVPGPGPHAGKPAMRLETRKGKEDLTVSWMVLDGARAVRYAEESYVRGTSRVNLQESWDPPRLRLDSSPAHTTARAAWREQYIEHSRASGVTRMTPHSEEWTVADVAAPCLVPGRGTLACLRVRKRGTSTDAGKTYWFAPCVGKVREEGRPGTGQTEQLIELSLP